MQLQEERKNMRFFRKKKPVPDGVFIKCGGCDEMVYRKTVEENLKVCPECKYHFRINAPDRINLHLDENSFHEIDSDLTTNDPLHFVSGDSYEEKIRSDREKSGLKEAICCGTARIDGQELVFAAMDFRFRGGSMGCVVGEKLSRAAETALEQSIPLVTISSSGGARMQEGVLSLMQMAKTCTVLQRLHSNTIPYISVMTHPTTGGVTASWASMGDVIVAEPGALIGFAGRRVIEQTVKEDLPEDFQTAEFLLQHGFIDLIVERKNLKSTLSSLLSYLS